MEAVQLRPMTVYVRASDGEEGWGQFFGEAINRMRGGKEGKGGVGAYILWIEGVCSLSYSL